MPEPGLGTGRQPHLEALGPTQPTSDGLNWDRGMDQPAANDLAQAIVDFLAGGLADHIVAE
jgi:hypothetical protein